MTTSVDARRLRDVIRFATADLADAGLGSPRHDAERLAAHALGVRWSDLWQRMDVVVDVPDDERLRAFVRRRAGGEPLAYVIGSTVFYGLTITCGPGALVPRPETEVLVDVALELIAGKDEPLVVDIGCGTGAVALGVATHRRDAHVIATDISEDALAYARANVRSHGSSVSLLRGDLFEALPDDLCGRIDLIVSNPPYVPEAASLPSDVRAEPDVALFAGPDGSEVLARLAAGAPRWLAAGGAVVLEIGDAEQASVLPGGHVRADLTGRPRVVWTRI